MSTSISRFPIHDELTAPEEALPVLRAASRASAGRLPNFLGVLAGAPVALRAYARLRSELRHGHIAAPTCARIVRAVAAPHGSEPDVAPHARAARRPAAGWTRPRAREWSSADAVELALLRWLRAA